MALILTEAEIREVTKRERPKAQAKELDVLGVPYRPRSDGSLVVSRAAAEAALGGPLTAVAGPDEPEQYDVDVEALHRHGKATATH